MIWAGAVAAAALGSAGAAFAAEPQTPVTDTRATLGSAVATPVQDLNLKKTPIPESLQKAVANPYDTTGLKDCAAIAGEIAGLDAALGEDKDAPPAPEADDGKGSTVATVLQTGVQAVIPYRGVVRQLSGAAGREKTLNEAIQVGFARRGFLKGRAVEMNCAAGASPAGYIQRPEVASAPVDVPPAPDIAAAPLFASAPPSPEAATAAPSPEAPAPVPAPAAS